jgi:hypothetical protein
MIALRTMRVGGAVAAAVLVLVCAGSALATADYGTIDIKYIGATPGGSIANINPPSESGYCGQYNLQVLPGSGTGYTGQWLVAQTAPSYILPSYCIDIHQNSDSNFRTYDIDALEHAPVPGGMTAAKADALRRLFTEATPNSDMQRIAFAAAVWEIVNETSGTYNVSLANFTVTGNGNYAGWDTQANTWLANLGQYSPNYGVVALVNATYQDYAVTVVGDGSFPPIPEPVTLCGLLMGIGGLVRYTRRRAA